MGEGLTVAEYVDCLKRLHGVVSAWEEYSAENVPGWLMESVKVRSRRSMLEEDLAWFGVTEHDANRPMLPAMRGDGGFAGAMYVMEGSRLGGQFIARHLVRVLDLKDGRGDAYFRGYGDRTGAMWREFCHLLREDIAEEETENAIEAAKGMFGVFGAWMSSGTQRTNEKQLPGGNNPASI
jgi:heme oxygenase